MVGFPGETDAEFEETLDIIRALPFGYLHLFPFSPRPGTRGWALHAAAPSSRTRSWKNAWPPSAPWPRKRHAAHRSRFVGQRARTPSRCTLPPALAAMGSTAALTENFLPIEIDGRLTANQLVRVAFRALTAAGDLTGSRSRLNLRGAT